MDFPAESCVLPYYKQKNSSIDQYKLCLGCYLLTQNRTRKKQRKYNGPIQISRNPFDMKSTDTNNKYHKKSDNDQYDEDDEATNDEDGDDDNTVLLIFIV